MKPPIITVKHLSMDFNGFRALHDLSFQIHEGEILGIIGRSGAGKTVLMHLLRGIEMSPTEGSIIYHLATCPTCGSMNPPSKVGFPCSVCGSKLVRLDVDLWRNGDSDLLRDQVMRRTALMFQRTFALYGNDRVIENVLKALDDSGYPADQAINRAADLIDRVRLTHRMMHIARDLSGGEKQRVVLARQLAKEPFLLFADEPTGTLDPRTARLVHTMLTEGARNQGMGMVITSHCCQVIEDVAHRALLLTNGEIAMEGDPTSVVGHFLRHHQDDEVSCPLIQGEPILLAREVEKKYMTVDRGMIRAVRDATFEVAEREIFGIIGTSGAGKTTLSRIIAGIITPTSGEVNMRVGDTWVDITKPGIEERGRAKSYIGLLHQEYDLYPHRTVLDNLTDAIGLEFPKELALHKARISLTMAGFDPNIIQTLLFKYPAQLSEGERHRVALAQVLIREPRLVVLDEPTGTMDPITKKDVRHSILTARNEMEETFIVVSHDLDFVRETCDRIAVMQGGRIMDIGTPSAVLEAQKQKEQERLVSTETGDILLQETSP
jgi:methyl coenzyme M reductase system subunit A2